MSDSQESFSLGVVVGIALAYAAIGLLAWLGWVQKGKGMKIYIAGPMTGYEDFNYPAFHAAERKLALCDVCNPARNFEGIQDLPYKEYIRQDIKTLLECDAIYLLCGWENSRGARLEKHIADVLGLEIHFQGDEDND